MGDEVKGQGKGKEVVDDVTKEDSYKRLWRGGYRFFLSFHRIDSWWAKGTTVFGKC